jgi:hypothetical protein
MANLFEVVDSTVKINYNLFGIDIFRAIYDRDNTSKKEKSYKEFCFIFYMADRKSPYSSSDPATKQAEIMKSVGLKNIDDVVIQCMEKYLELQETSSSRMYYQIERSKDSLATLLKGKNDAGLTENDLDMVLKLIDKFAKLVSDSNKIKDIIDKESNNVATIKGGGIKGIYEDGFPEHL